MRASGVSLFYSPPVSPPMTLAAGCLCWCVVFLVVCLFCCVCCFLFCKCHVIFSNPPRVLDLDDRQGLTASSAMQ